MSSYNRAERRRHRHHLILKRRKQNNRYGVGSAINESEWRFFDERVRARTGTLCSCSTCGNARRHYGNSVAAKTQQEVRSALYLKEMD